MKNYWFSLQSHIYVKFEEDSMLLYNTQSGDYLETDNNNVILLIKELYKPENLGVTLFDVEKQENPIFSSFVREIVEKEFGDISDTANFGNKPVRLLPILNLQRDVEKMKDKESVSALLGKDIINYLISLNIYVNSDCNASCPNCKNYYKQFNCCTTDNVNQEISFTELEKLFQQIKYAPVGRVNILGGNILQYSELSSLFELANIHCYIHYKNYINKHAENVHTELMVDFPLNESLFNDAWKEINHEKITVNFIVENEEQYYKAEELVENYDIRNYQVFPFYNDENIAFFEENIFLQKEDVFNNPLGLREIFRNQKLNSNFFGTLNILPDGSVKANTNTEILGNIKSHNLLDIIYKEMTDNTAWRKVRDMEPCNKCLYQYLCPAPSNYETAIGKPNLCNLHS